MVEAESNAANAEHTVADSADSQQPLADPTQSTDAENWI